MPQNSPSSPSESFEKICSQLLKLKLTQWASIFQEDYPKLPPEHQQLIGKALLKWAQAEISERQSKTIQNRIRSAKFTQIQSIDGFDFAYNASTRKMKDEYLQLLHKTSLGEILPSAIFVGNTGLGKTRLARSLGYAACQAKRSVLFTNVAEMLTHLNSSKTIHTLGRELAKYQKPDLLILDEVGYISLDAEASNLFFQVVSKRYDRRLGTVVTTNMPFSEWNQIFAGNATAHVVIDRLAENSSIFYMEGDSYRSHLRSLKQKSNQKK